MLNFDTELDRKQVTHIVRPQAVDDGPTAPAPSARQRHTYIASSPGGWDWEALRDYVVSSISKLHGPVERNFIKEKAIFSRFVREFGPEASEKIARYSFEVKGGWYQGSPVGVNRFCRGSDPYFAIPIARHMGIVSHS